MTVATRQLAPLLAGLVLLAGCASAKSAAPGGAASASQTSMQPGMSTKAGTSMTPGMVMPDGSTMGAATSAPAPKTSASVAAKPSASALMICSADVRGDLAEVLAMKQIPAGRHTFANGRYTCTYRLADGPLLLSVQDEPDAAATTKYFRTLRDRLGMTAPLDGLGEGAYGTDDGTVVLRKDNHVLRVDASRMSAVIGRQHAKRNDFAYEVATVILGCWTGD